MGGSGYGTSWQVSPEDSDSLSPLVESARGLWLSSWHRDGRYIAAVQSNPDTGADILIWDMQERKLRPFLNSRWSETYPEFSPDGGWLAYSSNETGRSEVYLRTFPGRAGKIQISDGGGVEPAFSADGRELFFITPPPSRMMKVDIRLGATPIVRRSMPLFDFQFLPTSPIRGYDLHSDGRRFICTRVKERPKPADITRIRFVENWIEELKTRVPSR